MSGPTIHTMANGPPSYPKREITSEPFIHQMDMVGKALIESQNQPPSVYINGNRGKKKGNYGKAAVQPPRAAPAFNMSGFSSMAALPSFVPRAQTSYGPAVFDSVVQPGPFEASQEASLRPRMGSVDVYSGSSKGTPETADPVMSGSNSSSTTVGSSTSDGAGGGASSGASASRATLGLFDPFKPFEADTRPVLYKDPQAFISSAPLELGATSKFFGDAPSVPTSIWGTTSTSGQKLGDTTVWG